MIGLKGLPAFGGAASVGENIIIKLNHKYDFTVFSSRSHTNLRTGNYNGAYQIVFRNLPFVRLNSLYYYLISAIHALIFGKYDVIHLHHRDAAFIIPLLKLKFKVILTTHGIYDITEKWKKYHWYFKLNEKFFIRYADYLTCVSKKERDLIQHNLGRRPIYIPNGVNDLDDKIGKSSADSDYILFAANRIIPSKGCHTLLQSLRLINFKGKIVIIGDINQDRKYKNQLLSLSTDLDVEFVGIIKDKNILFSYIKNAMLFIFPSQKEAASMMLLEVASIGIPIIASNIVDNMNLFDDSEIMYFKTNDPEDLAAKITFSIQNYSTLINKAVLCRKKVCSEYLWDRISVKYASVYDQSTNN